MKKTLLKLKFEEEYENYILPYHNLTGIKADKKRSFNEYFDTFGRNNVHLVYYKYLNWYPKDKYAQSRVYFNPWTKFFAADDLSFFNVFKDKDCHRHARQHIELCCDLYTNEPTIFPVRITPTNRVHPGNCLIRACKFLEKPIKILHVSPKNFRDKGVIIKKCECLDDIQQCYGDKKIFAWFFNNQKTYGLQVVVFHSNWTQFDKNGNLQWRSDNTAKGKSIYPLHKFLDYLVDKTYSLNACKKIKFDYCDKKYTLKNPKDKQLSKKIFLDAVKWGNENLVSSW